MNRSSHTPPTRRTIHGPAGTAHARPAAILYGVMVLSLVVLFGTLLGTTGNMLWVAPLLWTPMLAWLVTRLLVHIARGGTLASPARHRPSAKRQRRTMHHHGPPH